MKEDNKYHIYKSFKIGDKVCKFINGKYQRGTYMIAEAFKDGYGIIPTDCKINGETPSLENTTPERFNIDGTAQFDFYRISIYKITDELEEKIDKYKTRMLIVGEITKALGFGSENKYIGKIENALLSRTTDQLWNIFTLMVCDANGKSGICRVNEKGQVEMKFHMPEEIVNSISEPI